MNCVAPSAKTFASFAVKLLGFGIARADFNAKDAEAFAGERRENKK